MRTIVRRCHQGESIMPRLHPAIATGLAVMLVVSCAKSGVDKTPASAVGQCGRRPTRRSSSPAASVAASDCEGSAVADVAEYAAPPPPPMAPPPPSAMAPRMVAPTLTYAPTAEPRPFPPPYRDVGRDRFTATSQNPFKVVARGAGLDLLDRCRHRVLFLRPRLAQPERAAAAGGGADRGDGQLFPL